MSNLRLINETNVSALTTSVFITDVFSADFDIYKITADNVVQNASASASSLHLRLINSSGSIESTSGDYDSAFLQLRDNASFFEGKSTTDTYMNIMLGQVDDNVSSNGAVMYIFNPYNSNSFTFALSQSQCMVGTVARGHKAIGVFTKTNFISGINIHLSSDGIVGGNFKVFGLRVD